MHENERMRKERMGMRSRKWRHKKYEQRKVSEKKKIEMKIFGKRTYHLGMAKTRKIMIIVKHKKQNQKTKTNMNERKYGPKI